VVTVEAENGSLRAIRVSFHQRQFARRLAGTLFATSEQLPTGIVLGADDYGASGLLVQRMPDHGGTAAATAGEGDRTLEADRPSRPRAAAIAGVQQDGIRCNRRRIDASKFCLARPARPRVAAGGLPLPLSAERGLGACCARSAPSSSTPCRRRTGAVAVGCGSAQPRGGARCRRCLAPLRCRSRPVADPRRSTDLHATRRIRPSRGLHPRCSLAEYSSLSYSISLLAVRSNSKRRRYP
jgi:hypothetical protein